MGKGVPIPPLQRPRSFQRDKYRQKEEDDNTYYIDTEKTRMPLLEEMESEWDFGVEVWHAGGWAGVLILNKLVRDYQFLFSSSSFSSLSPLLFLLPGILFPRFSARFLPRVLQDYVQMALSLENTS